tara:strand:- start:576 stop:821 length:246 start_codon:yes stop_codon:yes gene_type:complete
MLSDSIATSAYKVLALILIDSFSDEMTLTTTPPKRPRRNTSVTIHLSQEEKREIAKLAFDRDEGTSQFARKIILAKLKSIK